MVTHYANRRHCRRHIADQRVDPNPLSPCVAWRCLRVERAMGIENTAGAHSPFGIMKLQARRELRAIFV